MYTMNQFTFHRLTGNDAEASQASESEPVLGILTYGEWETDEQALKHLAHVRRDLRGGVERVVS